MASATPASPRKRKVTLYKPHTGQLQIHRSKARFRVVACGRRYGKTLMACNEIVRFALRHTNAECGWVAPWFRQSKIAYRLIRRAMREVITYKSDAELRIEFGNGSVIQFFSAENYDAIRGNGFHFLVIDEAGDALRDPKMWTDAIRPALSDKNGHALIIGTPKGRNQFFHLFARGEDEQYPEWEQFHAPSSANPYMPKSEIETARNEVPDDTFQQEYAAQFLEEAAGVFKGIDRCIKGLLDPEYQRVKGHFYVVGWDPAKYQDYSVVTVMDCHTREVVAWQRINQVDYTVQIGMVSRIAEAFQATVYMDVTGVGAPLAEQLKTEGRQHGFHVEEYLFTNASKKELVEGLQLAIQHGDITLKNIPVLINELRIYEYQMTPSRNVTYGAPKGAHDDAATSLMLANYGASQPHGPVMWSVDTYDVTPQEPPRREDGTAMQMVEIERVDMFEMHNEFAEVGQFYDMGGY